VFALNGELVEIQAGTCDLSAPLIDYLRTQTRFKGTVNCPLAPMPATVMNMEKYDSACSIAIELS